MLSTTGKLMSSISWWLLYFLWESMFWINILIRPFTWRLAYKKEGREDGIFAAGRQLGSKTERKMAPPPPGFISLVCRLCRAPCDLSGEGQGEYTLNALTWEIKQGTWVYHSNKTTGWKGGNFTRPIILSTCHQLIRWFVFTGKTDCLCLNHYKYRAVPSLTRLAPCS